MLLKLLLVFTTISVIYCEQENRRQDNGFSFRPLLFLLQRSLDLRTAANNQQQEHQQRALPEPTVIRQSLQETLQQQKAAAQGVQRVAQEKDENVPAYQQEAEGQSEKTGRAQFNQQQYLPENLPPYAGLPVLQPQFQYPGFNFVQNKQLVPRVQPQIVFYGPGGQGQPILFNPGSPPGNFLIPNQPQPGPNIFVRDNPQRPVFLAGYPKPAHIPPIEKDAEEVPTNPARVPPLQSSSGKRPEKLETFNEGKNDYSPKSSSEADGLAGPDKIPERIPIPGGLKPGQRYFILNGEPLFPISPPLGEYQNIEYDKYQQGPLSPPQQPQFSQKQKEFDLSSIPFDSLLLNNQIPLSNPNYESKPNTYNPVNLKYPQPEQIDLRSQHQIQNYSPENSEFILPKDSEIPEFQPQQAYFIRSEELPLPYSRDGEMGQFRYTPPAQPYFPFGGEDIENDAVIVNAAEKDLEPSKANKESQQTEASGVQKNINPSTAQAAPGAIALAGVGGVAGASPRGTALVGKGGLAISSPHATAVAGPREGEKEDKKQEKRN